jgi:hypothetical protein
MSQMGGPGTPGGVALSCANCGAPDAGELVICRFCQQPVSAEAQRTAIPCPNPQCRTLCRWGKQKCPQCQAWIVVSCVFCGAISPHSAPNCLSCNEAFAGAPQRKAQMERERMQGQHAQQASVWGGVAASFLGAAAGSVIGEALSSHDGCSSYSTCSTDDVDDVSDVSDDTGFDFGDDD